MRLTRFGVVLDPEELAELDRDLLRALRDPWETWDRKPAHDKLRIHLAARQRHPLSFNACGPML